MRLPTYLRRMMAWALEKAGFPKAPISTILPRKGHRLGERATKVR